jgi:methyltransferase-like protein/SAM-dependent methyltransferase
METFILTEEEADVNSYDELPYESHPFPRSAPSHLQTIGTILGMKPPFFEKARVLELGCASGGNLIPHAFHCPEGRYVGIDLSAKQIGLGQATIKNLGLKNITLLHKSIMDLDGSLGMFDYILCHGVLSWVPEAVRDRIFSVIKAHLSPRGLAYVSYNVLPGWIMLGSVRDMMLSYAPPGTSAQDRLQRARLFLSTAIKDLEGITTPYAHWLRQSLTALSRESDHYLFHEYLEEVNHPYYFKDFVKEAGRHGLQYVGETNLATMVPENISKQWLGHPDDRKDTIRTEQSIDFMVNRRFRETLLCHDTVPLQREIAPDIIKHFSVVARVVAERLLSDEEIMNRQTMVGFYFKGSQAHKITTASPVAKALFDGMQQAGQRQTAVSELVRWVSIKLPSVEKTTIQREVHRHIMTMVLKDYLTVTVAKPSGSFMQTVPDKPRANRLVLDQVTRLGLLEVTNDRHERVGITPFQGYLLRFLDGQHGKEEQRRAMEEGLRSGALTFSYEGQSLSGDDTLDDITRALVEQEIERSLQYLWTNGCLTGSSFP